MFAFRCSLMFAVLTAVILLSPRSSPAADPELATVQGTVTLDGKPLAGGKIIFHLTDGQFVGAQLKKDGTYKVERVPVGTCKVTLEATVEGKSILPLRYAREDTTDLQVEVKKGANVCDFKLKSR